MKWAPWNPSTASGPSEGETKTLYLRIPPQEIQENSTQAEKSSPYSYSENHTPFGGRLGTSSGNRFPSTSNLPTQPARESRAARIPETRAGPALRPAETSSVDWVKVGTKIVIGSALISKMGWLLHQKEQEHLSQKLMKPPMAHEQKVESRPPSPLSFSDTRHASTLNPEEKLGAVRILRLRDFA